MQPANSYLSRIRGVQLLPGERARAFLNPESGLNAEPPPDGQLLVATNRRFINLLDGGETQSRQMFALASVSGVSVRNDVGRGLSWQKWASLVVGGAAVYLALAYWLVDRLPLIVIPVVNLHAFALAIMVLVVVAGWLFWRGLSHQAGRVIQVHGMNWTVEVNCTSDQEDLMSFAHTLILMRSTVQTAESIEPAKLESGVNIQ